MQMFFKYLQWAKHVLAALRNYKNKRQPLHNSLVHKGRIQINNCSARQIAVYHYIQSRRVLHEHRKNINSNQGKQKKMPWKKLNYLER